MASEEKSSPVTRGRRGRTPGCPSRSGTGGGRGRARTRRRGPRPRDPGGPRLRHPPLHVVELRCRVDGTRSSQLARFARRRSSSMDGASHPWEDHDLHVHVGIADHFGWAMAVTASADHQVVDRRRIELVEPGVSRHRSITRAPGSASRHRRARRGGASVDPRAAPRPSTSWPPVRSPSISLRTWPPDFPTDIAVQLRGPGRPGPTPSCTARALRPRAERGWEVHLYDARDVWRGRRPARRPGRGRSAGPAATLGPPWTKDHRRPRRRDRREKRWDLTSAWP